MLFWIKTIKIKSKWHNKLKWLKSIAWNSQLPKHKINRGHYKIRLKCDLCVITIKIQWINWSTVENLKSKCIKCISINGRITVKSLDTLLIWCADARAIACFHNANCTMSWISDTYERQFETFITESALASHIACIRINVFTHIDINGRINDINHLKRKRKTIH